MRVALYIRFSNEADLENSEKEIRKSGVRWGEPPHSFKDGAKELSGNGRGRRHLYEKDTGVLYPSFHQ